MVDKYIRIRDAANHVAAVEYLLPRGSAHRRIVALHEKLKELNSYPGMGHYLDEDEAIVHSPVFESALIKITSLRTLSSAELKTLEPFRSRRERVRRKSPQRRTSVNYMYNEKH
ncbi:hypothetical protein JG687_00018392 [Phytophthora cactorum]|uniref:Uncharacterized protein n=1 Tax=Phytophthora cactorum TaxID=29920 RepID=A0A8T1TPL8_9STRA|nr:hypothetical protein GQ600_1556 [Phytophthora cactorum]KAG6943532.1 hypothetical protein JG687_00018392 [Phytophthora cactorum]